MRRLAATFLVTGALFAVVALLGAPDANRKTTWERVISPGALSRAHHFLEQNCESCHTPVKGVEASTCVECHASEERLLKRQPTAFHAHVTECTGCHQEHQGRASRITRMDHEALAALGLREISQREGAKDDERRFWAWFRGARTASERSLDCSSCHSNQDRHFKLFGTDCAECHATSSWKIAAFRHPSPESRDCSQCHQAPPSHYMEHFEMVSMKAARVEHANVSQCYLCHQATSWNDIRGVGWYKHH